MEKIVVLTLVKDDIYSKNTPHFLEKHLDDIKAGVLKFAESNDAKEIKVLIPKGMANPGFDWEVKEGSQTPTADNPYSVKLQFEGKLPRPMIQDDFVAVYEEKEVLTILPEDAYLLGKGDSSIKHITVNGEVKEVSVGTKLSEVVDCANAKAVLVGGLKGKIVLPETLAEMEVGIDELFNSVTAIPKDGCIVDFIIKHMDEVWKASCGKCVMCREGTLQFKTIVSDMNQGKAKAEDIDLLKEVSKLVEIGAYCPYGKAMPQPMLDAFELFADEFDAHIKKKTCPAGVCYKGEEFYVILPDVCTGCEDCADECDEMAIEGKKGYIHMIDQDMCEHCGKCVSACDEGAIVKVEGKMPKLPKKLTKVGRF